MLHRFLKKSWYLTEPSSVLSWFYSKPLLTLVSEVGSGDVDVLAANDDDLLSSQQLLGDGCGKATEQVSLSVNDDSLRGFSYQREPQTRRKPTFSNMLRTRTENKKERNFRQLVPVPKKKSLSNVSKMLGNSFNMKY